MTKGSSDLPVDAIHNLIKVNEKRIVLAKSI
jgi:hypothetical protein